jgi:hypothetical protein
MMRQLQSAFLVLLLSACASLTAPQTFEQRLAYGYGSVTAVRQTAADLLVRDRITVAQAEYVQEKADQARQYLDLAKGAPDPGKAQDNLQLALTILTALESTLREAQ